MFTLENSVINTDDIARDLEEIESKYSLKNSQKCPKISSDLNQSLTVLSKELDSIGLKPLKLEKPIPEILEQVIECSRSLVQIHRNTVNQIKDQNIEIRNKNLTRNQLHNKLEESKNSLEKCQDNCVSLQSKSHKLNEDIKKLHTREVAYKEELEKMKRFYHSKQTAFEHNIRKLKMENERLKEMFGKDIVSENSTNEVALKLLKKYKINEEIYKSTIKKLQENNRQLLEEVLNLKEEVILINSKK